MEVAETSIQYSHALTRHSDWSAAMTLFVQKAMQSTDEDIVFFRTLGGYAEVVGR